MEHDARPESHRAAVELIAAARGQADLSRSLGLDPVILQQLVESALALIELGKLDEAERRLEDLSRVAASAPTLPFLLGACREEGKKYPQAIDAYSEALRRTGADAVLRQQVLLARGNANFQIGALDHALGQRTV